MSFVAMKVFLDLKQHVNDDYECWETDCFETNFDILLQFCVLLWHTKVDSRPSDRKSRWKTFLGGNQTFCQLQNAIKPSIFIRFFELKFKKTYLELPKLFYIKSKVNIRPIEKLHFKLGFPNWYLRGFKISFSVIIQLSN